MTLITTVPALQAHSMLRYAAWRAVVAEFVAQRLGDEPDDLVPRGDLPPSAPRCRPSSAGSATRPATWSRLTTSYGLLDAGLGELLAARTNL